MHICHFAEPLFVSMLLYLVSYFVRWFFNTKDCLSNGGNQFPTHAHKRIYVDDAIESSPYPYQDWLTDPMREAGQETESEGVGAAGKTVKVQNPTTSACVHVPQVLNQR